jgi:hypothetical protein
MSLPAATAGTDLAHWRSFRLCRGRTLPDIPGGDVIQGGGGLSDDGAAVGMADQHHRAVNRVDARGDRAGVESQTMQRIRRCNDGVSGRLQLSDHSAEAGGAGESAMNQNDCRCCWCRHRMGSVSTVMR